MENEGFAHGVLSIIAGSLKTDGQAPAGLGSLAGIGFTQRQPESLDKPAFRLPLAFYRFRLVPVYACLGGAGRDEASEPQTLPLSPVMMQKLTSA